MSRKLWLRVARHVVQEKNDIKQAMEFLKECPSVKIEDILPFFPDFVTIDHFKDAICSSLQDYSDHIQSLKQEMKEASASAGVIRDEIVTAKSDHHFVRSVISFKPTLVKQIVSRFFFKEPINQSGIHEKI